MADSRCHTCGALVTFNMFDNSHETLLGQPCPDPFLVGVEVGMVKEVCPCGDVVARNGAMFEGERWHPSCLAKYKAWAALPWEERGRRGWQHSPTGSEAATKQQGASSMATMKNTNTTDIGGNLRKIKEKVGVGTVWERNGLSYVVLHSDLNASPQGRHWGAQRVGPPHLVEMELLGLVGSGWAPIPEDNLEPREALVAYARRICDPAMDPAKWERVVRHLMRRGELPDETVPAVSVLVAARDMIATYAKSPSSRLVAVVGDGDEP